MLAKIPINPIPLKLALLQKYKYVGRVHNRKICDR